ncbi:MAG: TIGR03619 family F420-dependent LLM class oxidoreductase [Deltaproteobacteria bacterium]|nr:TIGR03619 family F420-dependent LLM class oxidoreductase [Deltaproteobacteria bacterium]MBW2359506.1 TIGR03619 family F420-dependent LLM class oxidoreductase [Deltaproteobacteria bacterium]
MSKLHSLADVTPALSLQPLNFAAQDPGVGGWQPLLDQGRAADAAGIDRLVVSDHVILGENLEAYSDPKLGGMVGAQQPTGPDGQWLDPLTVISMWAALTTHTRFMTGILIAGLRRPANLAKQTATIDVLSHGRLDLGVGVGWQREEYEANGVPHAHRGARLDQTLEICQRLWTEEPAAYASEEVSFEKVHCNPKPLQPGGVPLWISGTLNPNVLKRIARFGSGWIPWGPDTMNPIAGLARIRQALEAAGRDASGFQVSSYLQLTQGDGGSIDAEQTMAAVPAMLEAGITDFRVTLNLPKELAACQDMLAPLVQAFRKAVGR